MAAHPPISSCLYCKIVYRSPNNYYRYYASGSVFEVHCNTPENPVLIIPRPVVHVLVSDF